MSDWWSKKLTGQPIAPQRTYLPTTPPMQMPMPHPAQVQQQQFQQEAVNAKQSVLDPTQAPTAQIDMSTALRLWKGGEAMRKEGNMTCPDCGSGNVFSRSGRGSGTTINGASPAPRCYECGWNGMYDQASQGNWIS